MKKDNHMDKLPLHEQTAVILGTKLVKYKTYKTVIARINKWTNWNESIWPISKDNFTKFITYLHSRVAPQTIISYLSVLKNTIL